ncbi:hypothetical protein IB292_02335 [Vibrio parahaemolyticus]|uniref:Uncharacterized protein n=1 Tax=Vibrio parahaemolyticus TaxID=670 RepID=A0A9Q3U9S6_VIBPH|nr:hypothetical protein [Vibrio parahaemolyticus]MCC3803867.1 hypothetical protein [Vibrio parahaemolyticus]
MSYSSLKEKYLIAFHFRKMPAKERIAIFYGAIGVGLQAASLFLSGLSNLVKLEWFGTLSSVFSCVSGIFLFLMSLVIIEAVLIVRNRHDKRVKRKSYSSKQSPGSD